MRVCVSSVTADRLEWANRARLENCQCFEVHMLGRANQRINDRSAPRFTFVFGKQAGSGFIILALEIKPSQGRIRVTLSGKAISPERQTDGFGPSSIDIPELSVLRKRKPA